MPPEEELWYKHGTDQQFSALKGRFFGGIFLASVSGVLQSALSGSPGEVNEAFLQPTVFPANKLSINMQCTPKTDGWSYFHCH